MRYARPHPSDGPDAVKAQARNQFKGSVGAVGMGATMAPMRIDIGEGVIVASSITDEAAEALALDAGDAAIAILKASGVTVTR
jgi:molybdopterin-binding protein